REVDDRSGIALGIDALSWLAGAERDWARAATLVGAADATWRSIPARRPEPLQPYRDAYVRDGRAALGARGWDTGYRLGAALRRTGTTGRCLTALGSRPAADLTCRWRAGRW